MKRKLSPLQQSVFDLLDAKPNTDVSIGLLYFTAYPTKLVHGQGRVPNLSSREMQQKIAPLLARINHKLKHGRIEPGQLKGTYRLVIRKRG